MCLHKAKNRSIGLVRGKGGIWKNMIEGIIASRCVLGQADKPGLKEEKASCHQLTVNISNCP